MSESLLADADEEDAIPFYVTYESGAKKKKYLYFRPFVEAIIRALIKENYVVIYSSSLVKEELRKVAQLLT